MKKKRTCSRRKFALRWLALLVLLVLGLILSGIYHILPDQTVAAGVQQRGLKPVDIIYRERGRYEVEDWLLLMGQNEDAIILTAARFELQNGWNNTSAAQEILFSEPDMYDRSWIVHKENSEREWICLFGFVPTGGQAPTFKIGMHDPLVPFDMGEYEDLSEYVQVGETFFDAEPYTVTPVPTIPVKGGMCYLEQVNMTHKTLDTERWSPIVLCDRTGEWEETTHWMVSSVVN